jgi:hypothetical protein
VDKIERTRQEAVSFKDTSKNWVGIH